MINLSLRELPFFIFFFFYSFVMSAEYGLTLGIHLTLLACGFFILCTPAASILYFFHMLPFAVKGPISLFRATFFWFFLLFVNIYTIFLSPGVFSKTLITRFELFGLTTWPGNLLILTFSLGFLIIHWLITIFFRRNSYKFLLHLIVMSISIGIFVFTLKKSYESMVLYLVDMSAGNY